MISRRLLRIKIFQVLYAHFSSPDNTLSAAENNLEYSIEKTYDLYCYLLLLPMAVTRYAESRIELGRQKKMPTYEDLHPNLRFVENRVTQQLAAHAPLQSYLEKKGLNWVRYPELIRNLYQELVASDVYAGYMALDACTYRDDRAVWQYFYETLLVNNDMFFDILEEQNIFWNDDVELVVSMILRTLSMSTEQRLHPLLPLYTDEDDKEFAFTLLKETIRHNDANQQLIAKYARNWDLERIAFADTLILSMAITEIETFPSVPVRVSFDEYLELSKFYSTEKSSVFINGILDRIVEELSASNRIVKADGGAPAK